MSALRFLGTGGAFCDLRQNFHNNAVVYTDEGLVLIDCSITAVQALVELGHHVGDIKGVIITHCHDDHVGGLANLLLRRFYLCGYQPTPLVVLPEIREELEGILEPMIGNCRIPGGAPTDEGVDLMVQWLHPVEYYEEMSVRHHFPLGGVKFYLNEIDHVPGQPATSLRIVSETEVTHWYTGDTNAPALPEYWGEARSRGPGFIFHDVSFFDKEPCPVHCPYTTLRDGTGSKDGYLPDRRSRTVLMHHTAVPEGIDVVEDGFYGAAGRFDIYDLTEPLPDPEE